MAALPPGWRSRVLSDADCMGELEALPGRNVSRALRSKFETAERGMIKADICRGAVLYNHGGIYLDVDVELYPPPPPSHRATTPLDFVIAKVSDEQEVLSVVPAWEPERAVF